ncbi:GTP 3',8-cyclase MoaA, partial [Pyxidicoccus sp. 3LG]
MTAIPQPQTDPLAPPLLDAQGRRMTYLRLSITDRCNFRCTYCSPASWGGKKDLLDAAELARITSVFASMGIRRVRLTGGEPLIRPDILDISRRITALPGIRHLAITSNASHLAALAVPLREAGVTQLNLSLDTLSPETFRRISKQGDFAAVLRGIDAAAAAGFASLKLNVVVMRDVNDTEVPALVEYAHARGIIPRFIELMPFGQGTPVPTAELVSRLQAAGLPLEPEPPDTEDAAAPPPLAPRATGARPGDAWASSPR